MKKKLILIPVFSIFATFIIFILVKFIKFLTEFGLVAFVWTAIFVHMNSLPDPPKPAVTYAEFPFKLVYEINGQRKVIEDTLICEFDGFGANEGQGKYREWKEHLKSGKKRLTIHKINKSTEIYYDPGHARYYMGDMDENGGYRHEYPNASMYIKNGYGETIEADELLWKYNIKLISWDYTPPIKNEFLSNDSSENTSGTQAKQKGMIHMETQRDEQSIEMPKEDDILNKGMIPFVK